MAIYLIGYDLNKSGKDYDGLKKGIEEISNGYWRHLDSTWLIGHPGTSASIRDALAPFLDSDDELLVVKISLDDAAWQGFSTRGSAWLEKALFSK